MFQQKRISDVFDLVRGISFPKSARDEISDEYVGCIRTANVQKEILWDDLWKVPKSYVKNEEQFLQINDIIVSTANSLRLLGKAAIIRDLPETSSFGTFVICLRPKEDYSPKYLYYTLQAKPYFDQIQKLASTTTNISNISGAKLKTVTIPVPSLKEQHRIVSRIEELFSELDNSMSTLQKTKEQLSVYRQAVLKEAFDSVKCVDEGARVKDVCNNIKVGIVIKPTQYYVESDGVKAFRNANVRRNYVDDDNWALISKEGHEKNKKSIVHTDDLVIARSGANLGMAAVVPEKCDGFNAIDIVIAELNLKVIDPHYLAYYVNSPYGLHVVNEYQHGGAQGHLNVKEFGLLPLILAPLSEQKSVVTEIESRLSVCDSIEQTVDTALQQAKAMRQSILKQAFEGRL